jgi:2'-5' RNA ligase
MGSNAILRNLSSISTCAGLSWHPAASVARAHWPELRSLFVNVDVRGDAHSVASTASPPMPARITANEILLLDHLQGADHATAGLKCRRPDAIFDSVKRSDIWRNYFDVVILPPKAIRDHAIELSRQLAQHGGKFVLGKRRFLPHISLYHIPVQPENFAAFSETVEQVAARHPGGDLRLRSLEVPFLMTDKPKWLKQLHLDIVNQTSKFFDWKYGSATTWKLEYVPPNLRTRAQAYLERFGSPLIDAAFRPHITLTTLETKPATKAVALVAFEPMTFHVDEISICELGTSHSCQRKIATYPLKSGY